MERKVSGKHKLQIEQVLPIVGLVTKSFRSGVLSAPLYSTDLIDGKCLKVNFFFLQTSYNLNIYSINNSREDIFTPACEITIKKSSFYDYLLMQFPYLLKMLQGLHPKLFKKLNLL